jgi:hypothetical protein
MPPDNPFASLSFIADPALLTNASTLMLMGTINRYGRALDRVRELARDMEMMPLEKGLLDEVLRVLKSRQLDVALRRVLLILRGLTAFYTAVGAFGLGTLWSLLGATFFQGGLPTRLATLAMFVSALTGVLCLVTGAGTLAWESRLTYRILRDEALYLRRRFSLPLPKV